MAARLETLRLFCHQSEFVSHFYDGSARISRVERLVEQGKKVDRDDPGRVFGLHNIKTPIEGGRRTHGFSDSVAAIEKETLVSPQFHDALIDAGKPHVSKLRIRVMAPLLDDISYAFDPMTSRMAEVEYDIFLLYPPNAKHPHLMMTAEVEIQDFLPKDLTDQKRSAEIIERLIKQLNVFDNSLGRHSLSAYSNKDMAVVEGGTDSTCTNTYPFTYGDFIELWGLVLWELSHRSRCCTHTPNIVILTDIITGLGYPKAEDADV